MKLLPLLLFFFISGFSFAQDSTVVQRYSSTLGVGEQLKFGDRSVKFKQLISDSRCPRDVTCVWAGEAKVLVEVFNNGKLCGEEVLVISGGGQGSISLNKIFSGGEYEYTLSGFSLQPYPETIAKIKQLDYTLSLEVKETIKN